MLVYQRHCILPLVAMLFSTSCGMNATPESSASTQAYVTPTSSAVPSAATTATPALPTMQATTAPVEGITTTQINVRSEPSTVGDSLGTIAPFSKVQILGKESNGAWLQIIFADSIDGKGWVTASYVQVGAAVELPLVQIDPGAGISGLVLQPIKIRSGPGTTFDALGTLSPNDVVMVKGKDSGGDWMQIEFKAGTGWVASQFLKLAGFESLPVTADTLPTAAATVSTESGTPIPVGLAYIQDNDSMQAPSVSVLLAPRGVGAVQFSGVVSSSHRDAEDWLQFTAEGSQILLGVKCPGSGLQVEMWQENDRVAEDTLSCQESRIVEIHSGQSFWLRVAADGSLTVQLMPYILKLELIH